MNRKSVFDSVRRMLGRSFSQSEVDALDRALDQYQEECSLNGAPSASSRRVSFAGIQLIRKFEGCARLRPDGLYEAYPDPGTGGAPWTIGWGATGPDIARGTLWTKPQCDARLEADIARHARDVAAALGNSVTSQGQFDALVSFHYNTGAIRRATLTRLHLEGRYALAAKQFSRWKYAGGRVLSGLERRRRRS